MPTEHAAKIRIYTFLSDVAPEGQAKTPVLFPSEQYQEMRQYSSEYCSEHCSDRTAKTLILRRSRQRKNPVYTQNNTCTLDKLPIIVYN